VGVCRARVVGAVVGVIGALGATLAVGVVGAVAQTGGSGTSGTSGSSTTTTTTTAAPATTLAPGAKKKLLVVGDSVVKGVEAFGGLPVLKAALPGYEVTFDAEESRSTVAGAGVILAHNPAQFDTVVVGLGANDAGSPDVFRARAKRVLDELQPNAHVFWLNLREVGRYAVQYKQANAALALLAGGYPNTQVIDWNAFANTLPPGQIAADGLHLSNASAVAMANLIADSVKGTSPFSHSTATTTTTTSPTSAPTTERPTTTKAPSSGSDSSNGVLIGIVVGAALLVVFVISALAGRRRAKVRRREERMARLDALFGADTTPPSGEVAEPADQAAAEGSVAEGEGEGDPAS